MSTLESITIRGFKSIASIDKLELKAINILIGSNGSGKSNFIGAFAFLQSIRIGGLKEYVIRAGGADNVLHFGSKQTSEIFLEVDFKSINKYEVTLVPSETDGLIPAREIVEFLPYGKPRHLYPTDRGEAGLSALRQTEPIAQHVQNWLDQCRVYHFHDTGPSSLMKKTNDVDDNRFFRPDASNLSAYLYFLSKKHITEYNLIRGVVRTVAPFFNDFVLAPMQLNNDTIRLEWKHVNSDSYFNASALSDGTLRFIALATLLLQPVTLRPSVILIDEPELGLHPYAITLLASLIKQASVDTQVIVSTQSPILLDHFEPKDVLVTERIDGGTVVKRLEQAPLQTWLEDYSLGQLWEKNELGGRPVAN